MKTKLITNCHNCPFCNNDNEYGFDGCNLINFLYFNNVLSKHAFDEMPNDKVNDDCPLKENDYTIKNELKPKKKPVRSYIDGCVNVGGIEDVYVIEDTYMFILEHGKELEIKPQQGKMLVDLLIKYHKYRDKLK